MGIYFLILSSSVKMVNQLLAGVHIASAAEAMAFAARLNLRTRSVFEILQHSRGYSWYISLIMPFLTLISHFSILMF
jgi:3-hydroxyisobutyrate dehydrogenase-like beta-hydroxyacid dehydrogenase